ncbi:MAG: EamA family transporter [Gemmataceae bacterium]|nr:EamA family transporter [Gemmataceae bacterium]
MNAAESAKPPTWALVVAFGVIYTSWGTTYVFIKQGVREEQLPPLLFGGARIVLAGILVLAWQLTRSAPLRLTAADFMRFLGVSVLLFVAGNGFIGYGQKQVDSSVAAVLAATTPLWIGLFATLWPRGERLTPRGWLGLFVGLLGVAVLIGPQWFEVRQPIAMSGALCVIGSALSWAIGSLILRHMKVDLPHLSAAGYQMSIGGFAMLLAGILAGELNDLPPRVTAGAVYVFLYLLIVGSLAGYLAFNWLLGHVSAAKVGTYAYVNPLVAVLIGWLVGEEVTWGLWAGMGVILFGVFLVRGGERPTPLARKAPHETAAAHQLSASARATEPGRIGEC